MRREADDDEDGARRRTDADEPLAPDISDDAPTRMTENLLRLILDAVPAFVAYIDTDHRYRFNNRAYEVLFDRPRAELYGKHLSEVLGQRAYQKILPYIEAALAGRKSAYEQTLPLKDGTTRYINATLTPDFDAEGRVRGCVALGRDLTEQKRAEDALREAETRAASDYERLLERVTHLAETVGAAGEHLKVFRALRDFALASVPCVGIFISLYDPVRDVRTAVYAWGDGEEADVSLLPPMPITSEGPNSRAVRTGQIIITDDYMNRKGAHKGIPVGPDNGLRPQSSLVVPMAAMGRIVGTIEVQSYERAAYRHEHLTAMKMAANLAAVALENMRLLDHERRARTAAEEANRTKDEFLATLSHELRTPLTAILGWSNILSSGRLEGEGARNAVAIIERNARTQQQIVDDILDVSRIITGNVRFNPQPMELAPVVQAAIDVVRPAASAKNIRLQTLFDPRLAPVMGDPARMQQVVWNLLSNAVKFTPAGGRVEVRVERDEAHARIIVSDSGIGIAQEFLPFVFDRFRQADQSTTRAFGGLGLGLAIVRHIVELHGGTVSVQSGGEGAGSVFTVELPTPPVSHADASASFTEAMRTPLRGVEKETSESPPPLVGVRVLVVDDEPDTLDLVAAILGQSGATVAAVSSARAALASLAESNPDVIVSDIGMPGTDGNELIRRVRALPRERGGETPAIALTAYAGEADRELSLAAGFHKHVPKPVDPAELVAVVADLAVSVEKDRRS
ncbi:MAG TPA: ATP-binding protein [Pyrinomonadaceae bacterium]|nr:ATP-binding protein [Pyrinomonadaceae bacterium]